MTTPGSRSRLVPCAALALALLLAACSPDNSAEVAALQAQTEVLEQRVTALEQASGVARSDAVLASTLTVVQAVGRGQDPTLLSSEDQVAFCRSTGWTIRDLAALGQNMRAAVIARDAGINACKEAGIENPTQEDVAATEPGKQWVQIVTAITQIQRLMESGQWAEARKPLAPRPAADGG